jgi:hypothetical protein
MRFVRGISIVSASVVLLSFAGAANADVMFSDLGPSDSFFAGSAFGFGPILFTGSSFTPTLTGSLDSIELALSTQSPSPDPSGTQVTLADTGLDGKPDHVLETFLTGTIPGVASPALLTVNSVNHPLLTAGIQYFIVVGEGPGGGWFYQNSIGDIGPVVNGGSTGPVSLFTSDESAFRVNGSPLSSVPEPGSFFLLGIGLAGIWLQRVVRTGAQHLP